jgi:hypothetical protein
MVGKNFTIKEFPVVFTILGTDGTNFKIGAIGSSTTQNLSYDSFMAAWNSGRLSLLDGTSTELQDFMEQVPKKNDTSNYFSFDDL